MKHTSLQIIRDEHSSLAAMLQSMRMMVERGPADKPENFFDVMRAMLFYIDEFPERLEDLVAKRYLRAIPPAIWPIRLFHRIETAVAHVLTKIDVRKSAAPDRLDDFVPIVQQRAGWQRQVRRSRRNRSAITANQGWLIIVSRRLANERRCVELVCDD